ncbi:MAG: PBP1A family penicillin-binding protein, partial [Myxococcales bacterium]|nr:PBP1A family penicillin-binding protein [Myxococcales bacterium]
MLLSLSLLGLLLAASTLWYFGRDLPSSSALNDYRPPQTTHVLDRDGELVGEIFAERRTVIPMAQIPRNLIVCVLAAEDADFYRHEGLDYPGIARAVARDLLSGRPAQGASTITQQVVKLLLLTPERTISRKIRELILARRIEQELSKDEILHLYLNHINFGHGRYGAEEAARYYFDKPASALSLAEASLIAGIPQSPANLSPRRHPEAARRRQLYVLGQLESKREQYWPDLEAEAIEAAREAEVPLAPLPEAGTDAPEILMLARNMLRELVGDEAFAAGGYTIHTSVDLDAQRAARSALQGGLEALDTRQHRRVPIRLPSGERRRRERGRAPRAPLPPIEALREGTTYPAEIRGVDAEAGLVRVDVGGHAATLRLDRTPRYDPEGMNPAEAVEIGARTHVRLVRAATEDQDAAVQLDLGPQGGTILLDPRSREVLAMIGGYEAVPGFNRAVQASRQPGSTFKPFVYALGIRSREFTPASIVVDAPVVYDRWQPSNYEPWRFEGELRLREALARSINLVAIRVMEQVQPPEVVRFAQQLGIESPLEPTLALSLGASEVTLLELVNAYATFAAGGRWAPARIVTRIEGPDGRPLRLPELPAERDVLSAAEAYIVTSMMTSVVTAGTARGAQRLGRPVAGKTGTSNEARDAWFVGFTPEIVGGVWVGFDDRRSLGRREGGGRSALPIWVDSVAPLLEGRPIVEFPRPSGVVSAMIDPQSGLLAYEGMEGAIEEVFLEGTAPTEVARPADIAAPDAFLMEQLG